MEGAGPEGDAVKHPILDKLGRGFADIFGRPGRVDPEPEQEPEDPGALAATCCVWVALLAIGWASFMPTPKARVPMLIIAAVAIGVGLILTHYWPRPQR